jgi:hypothetical protein
VISQDQLTIANEGEVTSAAASFISYWFVLKQHWDMSTISPTNDALQSSRPVGLQKIGNNIYYAKGDFTVGSGCCGDLTVSSALHHQLFSLG